MRLRIPLKPQPHIPGIDSNNKPNALQHCSYYRTATFVHLCTEKHLSLQDNDHATRTSVGAYI
jgi:hypothetical protein